MLSNTALYAVRAAGDLANLPAGEYAGAGAVAERIGAPPNYLSKLLQTLVRHGVVLSRKGTGGGFRLARDPTEISLFHVVEPIDTVSRWNGCFLGDACCGDENGCAVHDRWAPARKAFMDLLTQSTVAEVAAGFRPDPGNAAEPGRATEPGVIKKVAM